MDSSPRKVGYGWTESMDWVKSRSNTMNISYLLCRGYDGLESIGREYLPSGRDGRDGISWTQMDSVEGR